MQGQGRSGDRLEQAEKALEEASCLAHQAEASHVAFAESLGEFRQKQERTRVDYDRARRKIEGYAKDYEQEARARAAGAASIAPAVPRREIEQGHGEPPLVELEARPGDLLAELYVTRQRTVIGRADGTWSSQEDGAAIAVPPGFVSNLGAPPSQAETRVLAAGTVLAELRMPRAAVTVDDDFLVVSMTGSRWGSGQWEYPLGDLQALQVVVAGPLPEGPGPWDVPAGAVIAELRTSRRAVFRYVDQWWTLAGRAIPQLQSAEMLKRSRDGFDAAGKRLSAVRQEAGPAAAERLRQAEQAYEKAWADLGRAEADAGFVPLAGPGQVLDPARPQVVVEPGKAIARLYGESLSDWAAQTSRLAPAPAPTTRVAVRGDRLEVRFAHALPLPASAVAEVSPTDRVAGNQVLASYFRLQQFDIKNYAEAAVYVAPFLVNTVIVAVADMVLSLLFASMAAFVFSRFRFPGKALFYGMIMVLMIPGVLNLIPLYVIVKGMGLVTPVRWINLLALILPSIAGGLTVNIYIMRNNLESLAKDLFDAARIDGAGAFQTYWHIALPLSKPIMGTLAIFVLLAQWNNFIWPWVVIKEWKNMPVTAGLALLEGQNLSDYGLQMAGSVLASLPLVVLFFFMMNLFIRGIQSGAIKA